MIYNKTTFIESDSECTFVTTISVGNNILDELTFCLEEESYDDSTDPGYGTTVKAMAVLDKDNLLLLAERLKINPSHLKDYMIEKFGKNGHIAYSSYVVHAYQKLLDFILDHGAKYRLNR